MELDFSRNQYILFYCFSSDLFKHVKLSIYLCWYCSVGIIDKFKFELRLYFQIWNCLSLNFLSTSGDLFGLEFCKWPSVWMAKWSQIFISSKVCTVKLIGNHSFLERIPTSSIFLLISLIHRILVNHLGSLWSMFLRYLLFSILFSII